MHRDWVATAGLTLQLLFCNSFLPQRAQSSSPGNPPPQSSLPDAPSRSQKQPGNPLPSSAASSSPKVDAPWPREVERGGERVAMFQPQIEAWEGEYLRAYASLSVANKDIVDITKSNKRK